MSGRRTTIAEVARQAGVGTATAGRVLGGYGYASEAARRRVAEAAEVLGYRPNALAKGLVSGRTRTIGVVAGDIANPFHAQVLRGVADVAEAQGLGLLITNTDETPEKERRAVEILLEKSVDGLVATPSDPSGAPELAEAAASGVPLVFVDRRVTGIAADLVEIDNAGAAQAAIARLIRAGHRRVGILAELGGPDRGMLSGDELEGLSRAEATPWALFPSWQRLRGYLTAHAEAGLPVDPRLVRRVGEYSIAAAERTAAALLDEARPTALFTTDGVMSCGAMAAIASGGLRLPGDLSLVGFDDLDWMSFTHPGIDAVRQPLHEMGRRASLMLLRRLSGQVGPPRHERLTTEEVVRGSVGPPRR